MAFRFRCPKCNTTSFSIERDSRSYAPRGQTHELIFSCRCGKQLFGEQIEKEYNRQKAEWEAGAAERRKEAAAKKATRPAASDDAYAKQRAARSERAAAEERAKESKRQEEDKKWRERVAAKSDDPKADEPSKDGQTCEWKDCDNPPRPNSKYCSRDCSNKNARYRYKRRKNRGKEAA